MVPGVTAEPEIIRSSFMSRITDAVQGHRGLHKADQPCLLVSTKDEVFATPPLATAILRFLHKTERE